MAYRWPAAVVLSSLVLAVTAAKLLSRPIPIAIKGGLQVDKLVLPPSVTIRSDTPLPVVVQEQVNHWWRCAPRDRRPGDHQRKCPSGG